MRLPSFLALSATLAVSNAQSLPPTCAPNHGIMSTPTYGDGGALFTVCAETSINGSPASVYNVLIDYRLYPEWNTFVVSVDLPSNFTSAADAYVGMKMTFHNADLIPLWNATSDEILSYLQLEASPPFVGWRYTSGAVGDLFFQAEHIMALWDVGGGVTRYVSWETYYGPGAVVELLIKDQLQTAFENQGRDLKARVESFD